jgi:uncharacterized protein YhaN
LKDGTGLSFRRRKGRKRVVVGETTSTKEPFDATGLKAFLDHATRELFENVFGFSLDEIAEGEKGLKDAGLEEALFGSALGSLASFQALKGNLQRESQDLYNPRGSKPLINDWMARIRTAKNLVRQRRFAPEKYRELQEQDRLCRERLEEREAALREANVRYHRLRRQHNAFRPHARRCEISELVESLEASTPEVLQFPREGLDRRQRLREELEEVEHLRLDLTHDRSMLENQLSRLQRDPAILRHAPTLRSLEKRLALFREYREEIEARKRELVSQEERIEALLSRVGGDVTPASLSRFQATLEQEQVLDRLREESSRLEAKKLREEDRYREIMKKNAADRKKRQRIVDRRESLIGDRESPEEFIATLRECLDERTEYLSDCKQWETLREEWTRQEKPLREMEKELREQVLMGDVPLKEMVVPLEATFQEHQRALEDSEKTLQRREMRQQELQAKLSEEQTELGEMETVALPPTEAELKEVRRRRDQLWEAIGLLLFQEDSEATPLFSPPPEEVGEQDPRTLVRRFEQLIDRADRMADHRLRDARLAQKRESLRKSIARDEKALDEIGREIDQAREVHRSREEAWHREWSTCGLVPRSPAAMQQWRSRYESWCRDRRSVELQQEKCRRLKEAIDRYASRWERFFPESDESIAVKMNRGASLLETLEETSRESERLTEEIEQQEQEAQATEATLQEWRAAEAEWDRRRVSLLESLDYPSRWSVATAQQAVGLMKEAKRLSESRQASLLWIEEKEAALAEFAEMVGTLAESLLSDETSVEGAEVPQDVLAETQLIGWLDRLQRAEKAEREQDKLSHRQHQCRLEIQKAEDRRTKLLEQRDALFEAAGASSEEDFLRFAEAEEKRRKLMEEMENLERDLRGILIEVEDADSFFDELDALAYDDIREQLRQWEENVERLEEERNLAREEMAIARISLEKAEEASGAAEAAVELESLHAQLQEAVDRYVPRRFAEFLLDRALERFKRENQSGILATVCEIFHRMTEGRYTRVQPRPGESTTFEVRQADDTLKTPDQLSTGTLQQLYLAMRLAYIRHYCAKNEPLPVIMDDVLVNFDDRRADATLRTIAEFAGEIQVIFLTCHRSMTERFERWVPECRLQELPLPEIRAT